MKPAAITFIGATRASPKRTAKPRLFLRLSAHRRWRGRFVAASSRGGAAYPNLKSAETRLDRLTWLSVIESVASSLIMTSDPARDIACVSAA